MSALDDLLVAPAPSKRRSLPDEATMGKILAARANGFSFEDIAAAFSKDASEATSKEMISRWVREWNECER